jgi:hypothetical protein
MHGPVGAFLAIFARAIHRIDDPHAALRQPFVGVLAFLAEQAVFRPLFA